MKKYYNYKVKENFSIFQIYKHNLKQKNLQLNILR
jgi:hypothetical protein